jgi:hypothetical protein
MGRFMVDDSLGGVRLGLRSILESFGGDFRA